ncbi:hypothetical protein M5K25_003066 [Dendrobium thyrsiflorum]|uniref:Uncharacterized protein n=1 Tax=Dendrobium thyrsiflorum TaxID=117978 RepID=A0ABD0VP76_DENTH
MYDNLVYSSFNCNKWDKVSLPLISLAVFYFQSPKAFQIPIPLDSFQLQQYLKYIAKELNITGVAMLQLLLKEFNHQNSPQEHDPSSKWWNLFLSLTTIVLPVILEMNFVTVWQSLQTRRFFTILIVVPGRVLINPKAIASFSLCTSSARCFCGNNILVWDTVKNQESFLNAPAFTVHVNQGCGKTQSECNLVGVLEGEGVQGAAEVEGGGLEGGGEGEGVWSRGGWRGEHLAEEEEGGVVKPVEGVGMDDGRPEEDVGIGSEAEEGEGEIGAADGGVRALELEVDDWVEVVAGAESGGVELEEVVVGGAGALYLSGEGLGGERMGKG